jgi:sec-independent protein translocase protein TatA
MSPFIGIMGVGGPEMVIIFVVILLLFGAKKLPELARGLGKSMGEFRRAKDEFDQEIRRAGDDIVAEKSKPKS